MDALPHDEVSLDGLQADLAALRRKVDLSWWRNPGNAIAALAFLLSLLTSLASILASHQRDLHDRQTELAGVVEKLTTLPLTMADFQARHSSESGSMINDQFTIQTTMLAHEGYALARRLGTAASPGELESVATALDNTGNRAAAVELLQLAVQGAQTWFDEVAARRYLGTVLIVSAATQKQREDGNAVFALADTVGVRFDSLGANPLLLAYTRGLTQERWGEALALSDCSQSGPHLQAAVAQLAGDGGLFDTAVLLRANARMTAALATCPPGGRLPFLPLPVQAGDTFPAPPVPTGTGGYLRPAAPAGIASGLPAP